MKNISTLYLRLITALLLIVAVIATIFYSPLWIFNSMAVLIAAIGAWEVAAMFWASPQNLLPRLLFLAIIVSITTLNLLFFTPIFLLLCGIVWWLIAPLILILYVQQTPINTTNITADTTSSPTVTENIPNLPKYLAIFFSPISISAAPFTSCATPRIPRISQIYRSMFSSISKTLLVDICCKSTIGICIFVPFALSLNILQTKFGAGYVLYVLALIWANDIGAFFAGTAYGKYLLAPTVSPKKTLEGLYGGIVLGIVVIICGGFFLNIHGIRWSLWIMLGMVVSLWSVIGDLFESMLKRQAKVKDSGNLLPGHGGIYDRIDSLVAAVPLFTAGLLLINF